MDLALGNPDERRRIARSLAMHGVTIIDALSTYIEARVIIGPGTIIEPGTVIIGGTMIGQNCLIRANTYIESSSIGDECEIGPFAHLNRCTVGNHVKMRHFGYLGDAEVGDDTNIGAGTITSNYDGERKHKTRIGKNAFIGTGTNFRAPVTVEDEGGTAAAALITKDVPKRHLGIRRLPPQTNEPGTVKKTKAGWKIGNKTKQNPAP